MTYIKGWLLAAYVLAVFTIIVGLLVALVANLLALTIAHPVLGGFVGALVAISLISLVFQVDN